MGHLDEILFCIAVGNMYFNIVERNREINSRSDSISDFNQMQLSSYFHFCPSIIHDSEHLH